MRVIQEQEQALKEALREVEREQKRVTFAERPVDMEYLKNTCAVHTAKAAPLTAPLLDAAPMGCTAP